MNAAAANWRHIEISRDKKGLHGHAVLTLAYQNLIRGQLSTIF